jgi:DNA-binding NtrC family response regulator
LFFRLNVVPIHVPPLRERIEDVPLLARQFMQRFARKHGVRVRNLSDACMAALTMHQWPGNVRELQNVTERAVILCGDAGTLEPEHLGFTPRAAAIAPPAVASVPGHAAPATNAAPGNATDAVLPLVELEKRHIMHALQQTGQNRTHAAKLLGISVRTLRNKLSDYGVTPKEENSAAAEEKE